LQQTKHNMSDNNKMIVRRRTNSHTIMILLILLFLYFTSLSQQQLLLDKVGPSSWQKTLLSPNLNLPSAISGAISATLRSETYGTRFFLYGGESLHGIQDDLYVFRYNVIDQWASYAEASTETCSREGWSGYVSFVTNTISVNT
jgi:hypothetical protein